MKKVLTIGAAGILGREITRQLEGQNGIEQSCFDIRDIPYKRSNGKNITGDVCDQAQISKLVNDKDYIICSLNGDWLKQAKSIVAAVHNEKNTRIIWVTGMGIHNEVPGTYGRMWEGYAVMYPDYIKAADVIAQSGIPYTLIRTADLTEGSNCKYQLYQEGEEVKRRYVSRSAVARLIVDIITAEKSICENESIGITN